MRLQPPSETRARAIEWAANAFDYLQDLPVIFGPGLQARADEALEDPAQWMRDYAQTIRESGEF